MAVLMMVAAEAQSQRHHETVVVGVNTAVRLRPGGATVVPLPASLAGERILASIHRDDTGEPEFYVTNTSILGRDGTVLTAGLQESVTPSLDVRVVIVPRPLADRRYYVFATIRRWTGSVYQTALRSVEVDMSVGTGAVADGPRTLDTNVGTGITTVRHCDGRRYWLVTVNRARPEFRVHQVTAAGLGEMVVTPSAEMGRQVEWESDAWLNSFLVANAQGTRVALLTQPLGEVAMLDFDDRIGKLSAYNLISRYPGPRPMMGTFSPDGTKFYWNDWRSIYVVDLAGNPAGWTPVFINAVFTTSDFEAGMFTGPDGRIYVSSGQHLVVITRPNNPHPNNGFSGDVVDLTSAGNASAQSFSALPLLQLHLLFPDQGRVCAAPLPRMDFDSVACLGTTVEYIDRSSMRPTSWRWTFQGGTPAQHNGQTPPPIRYMFPGIYRIRLIVANEFGETELERFVRVEQPPTLETDSVPALCRPGTVRLATRGARRYQWFPTSLVTDPTSPVTEARVQRSTWIYIRGWSVNECEVLDSVYVRVDSVSLDHLQDTAICEGGTATFAAIAADNVRWEPTDGVSDPASPQPILRPRQRTMYTITARRGTCTFSKEVTIDVLPNGQESIRIDTVCVGDTVELASFPGALWTGLPPTSIIEDRRVRAPVARSFSARMLFDRGGACRLRRDIDVMAAAPAVGRLTLDDAPFEVGKERRIRIGSVPPIANGELLVRLVMPSVLMEPRVVMGDVVSSDVDNGRRTLVIRARGGGQYLAEVVGQVLLAPLDRVDLVARVDSASNCVQLERAELSNASYTGCGVRMRPVLFGVATAAAVHVWPQPVARGGVLMMESGGSATLDYRVVDAIGRVVVDGSLQSEGGIDIPHQLAAGVYALQVRLGGEQSVLPIVVE